MNSNHLVGPPLRNSARDLDHFLQILMKIILVLFALLLVISCRNSRRLPKMDEEPELADVVGLKKLLSADNPLTRRLIKSGIKKKIEWVDNKGPDRKYKVQRGYVSYYQQPQSTADGSRFDPEEMSAAHTQLPLYSIVRCTRLDTGRSVVVVVTDRGPYYKERILDLSLAAGRKLGLTGKDGIARCRVEVLAYPREMEEAKTK